MKSIPMHVLNIKTYNNKSEVINDSYIVKFAIEKDSIKHQTDNLGIYLCYTLYNEGYFFGLYIITDNTNTIFVGSDFLAERSEPEVCVLRLEVGPGVAGGRHPLE